MININNCKYCCIFCGTKDYKLNFVVKLSIAQGQINFLSYFLDNLVFFPQILSLIFVLDVII